MSEKPVIGERGYCERCRSSMFRITSNTSCEFCDGVFAADDSAQRFHAHGPNEMPHHRVTPVPAKNKRRPAA